MPDYKRWLGYSRDYSDADNWLPSGEPGVADTVAIPSGTQGIDPYDASGTLLASFTVEDGHLSWIGQKGDPLKIASERFTFKGWGGANLEVSDCDDAILAPLSGKQGDFLTTFGASVERCYILRGFVEQAGDVADTVVVADPSGQGVALLRGSYANIVHFGGTIDYRGSGIDARATTMGGRFISDGDFVSKIVVAGGRLVHRRGYDNVIPIGLAGVIDFTECYDFDPGEQGPDMLAGTILDLRRHQLDELWPLADPDVINAIVFQAGTEYTVRYH